MNKDSIKLFNQTAIDDNGIERKIIARKEAKELRLKRFFTGVECRNGHISERNVNVKGGFCWACREEYQKSEAYKIYRREYEKSEEYLTSRREYEKSEECLTSRREYRQSEKGRSSRRKHRDKLKNIFTYFSAQDERDKLKKQKGKCASCQKKFKLKRLCKCPPCKQIKDKSSLKNQRCYQSDHIFARAKALKSEFYLQNGYYEYFPKDLQLLCQPCNSEKLARDNLEYMNSKGKLL